MIAIEGIPGTRRPIPVATTTRSIGIAYRSSFLRVAAFIGARSLHRLRTAHLLNLVAVARNIARNVDVRQRAGQLFFRVVVMTGLEQRDRVVVTKVFLAAIEHAEVAERFDGVGERADP